MIYVLLTIHKQVTYIILILLIVCVGGVGCDNMTSILI